VRILPNHACATAAQHRHYDVIGPDGRSIVAAWPRIAGW
jgi:D-serine deaminase-like pyridoxal phosphate-dependent protein